MRIFGRRADKSAILRHQATCDLRAPCSTKSDAKAASRRRKIPRCIGKLSDAVSTFPAAEIPSPPESSSAHSGGVPAPTSPPHPDGFLLSAVPVVADRPATLASFLLARPLAHPPATSAPPRR